MLGPIGVFGGTFDPIHYGHLRTAHELMVAGELSEVRFVPCGDPPHRVSPQAGAALRAAMVRAAIAGRSGFVMDDRELGRQGPCYSVDTLESMSANFPRRPLCLLLGMDAFLGLPSWHRWHDILKLSHLLVAHRPGWLPPTDGAIHDLLEVRSTAQPQDLANTPSGKIFVQEVTQLEIASTNLRNLIKNGGDPAYLMPDRVIAIIEETDCYADPSVQ